MAKTPTAEVPIEDVTEDVASLLHKVGDMPKVTRASGIRSDSVKVLAEAIKDGESHYLSITTIEDRDKWRRKLVYAGRVAGMDVKTVFLAKPGPNGEDPGLYFRGREKAIKAIKS